MNSTVRDFEELYQLKSSNGRNCEAGSFVNITVNAHSHDG